MPTSRRGLADFEMLEGSTVKSASRGLYFQQSESFSGLGSFLTSDQHVLLDFSVVCSCFDDDLRYRLSAFRSQEEPLDLAQDPKRPGAERVEHREEDPVGSGEKVGKKRVKTV